MKHCQECSSLTWPACERAQACARKAAGLSGPADKQGIYRGIDPRRKKMEGREVFCVVMDDRVHATAGSVSGAVVNALERQTITLKDLMDGQVQVWRLMGRAGFEVIAS